MQLGHNGEHAHTHIVMKYRQPTGYLSIITLLANLEDDVLHLSAQFATSPFRSGVHEFVGRNALAGHTVIAGQHPNDDVRDTVLGLWQ